MRIWRRIHPGRNSLARSWDRIEAAALIGVVAGALLALPLAALTGTSTYAKQAAVSTAQRAARHPTTATLLTDAPPAVDSESVGGNSAVEARWVLTNGATRTGMIDAPAGTRAGTTVPIWLTNTGNPAPAPPTPTDAAITATLAGAGVWLAAVTLLTIRYWNTRRRLDRLRTAQWDRDWAVMSTQWTTRSEHTDTPGHHHP
jgi:hypothetical protein